MPKPLVHPYSQRLIGVGDEGDEDRKNNVDEEANEDVQVDLAEDKSWGGDLRHSLVSGIHVITIDQCKQTV